MKDWQAKEDQARKALEKEFNMVFKKSTVLIGEYGREIDWLSEDGSVAAQVKDGRCFEGKRINATRFAEICLDCLILTMTTAKRKIMFIGDPEMHEQLEREVKGFPFHEIEIRLV